MQTTAATFRLAPWFVVAATHIAATTNQGARRKVAAVVCMSMAASVRRVVETSEVYRRDDRVGVRSHRHELAGRDRTADVEGTRAASGRWAGRKSLPGRRAPKGGTGEAAARARSRIRRLVELVVKRPGCRRGRDQRHVTLAGIGVLPQIHGD